MVTTYHTKANPQQREAIETTEGPLLIIAGPGSGKTFTLVERVVYLILHKNAAPESLFVATFTDKAAQELRTRVSNRLAELGVRFVVLGPTYDVNILDLFSRSAEDTGVKVFASIMLLKSVAMVRYLNNLPGVPSIPHEFLKMMMKAPVKAQAGLNIAASFVGDIKARCQGAVLITIGWENRLPEFLDLVGR